MRGRFYILPMSFRDRSPGLKLAMERLKNENYLVTGSFHFRMRRNETLPSFDGMTGRRSERPSLFKKGVPNVEEGGLNDGGHAVIPIFHSCHSGPIPRSKVVLSHSGRKGTFRMTSERCRNEGRGGAEVGCFPQYCDVKTPGIVLILDSLSWDLA